MRPLPRLALATALLVASGGVSAQVDPTAKLPPPVSRKVEFARDVEPILARSCHSCHGAAKQKGALRLDTAAGAASGGGSGPAYLPGKSGESLLVSYVAGLDPDNVMPPKGTRLTAEEIGVVRAWIDQGAVWKEFGTASVADARPGSDHWAFRPVRRASVPPVRRPEWVRNPIDAFILAKLEAEGIAPSDEADRATLIRRLNLDLLGMPPTPLEVDAFLDDGRPDAYERLVDRVLASPRFGERWGRHWLDLARYADSDGYEKDSPRPNAWRYRNWVIEALNRDLPFDRFTVAQIAGDLIPNADLWTRLGTGFHRNTLTNKEGGVDQEEYRIKAVVDRVNTTGTVWLGLTVGCAQCHTHKYDPILHKEYYGLLAFFNSQKEDDLTAPLPGELHAYEKAKAAFDAEQARLVKDREAYDVGERVARQEAWESSVGLPVATWRTLKPTDIKGESSTVFKTLPDKSILATGYIPDTDVVRVTFEPGLPRVTALRLELLPDPSLPASGPGRAVNGNLVLTDVRLRVAAKDDQTPGREVKFRKARSDFSQNGLGVGGAIDDDPKTGWALAGSLGKRHVAVFELAEALTGAGDLRLSLTLAQGHGEKHTLGRFRLSAIGAAGDVPLEDYPTDVVDALSVPRGERTAGQKARLVSYHRATDPEWVKRDRAVVAHASTPPALAAPAPVLVEDATRRKTNVLIRGDFLRPGAEVEPGTLGVLPPLRPETATPNRLDLARWLVDPSNPLTPRVAVNRVWHYLFGRGLVPTLDDFGTRGERPSHPELLDWLASEFVDDGWSQKRLIKQIVTSAAYRQSSAMRPDLLDRDANNVWLARQNRLRLEAEVLRDVTLASSGLLTPVIGGPSVHPPQPSGISDLTYAGSARWVDSKGPDRYRRGLYTFFQRTSPYPMLMTFDAPDSNVCLVRRERSNTPLQALTLLNDATFLECAQALGRRVVEGSPDDTQARLRQIYALCLARRPTDEERRVLTRLHGSALTEFRARPGDARKLAGTALPKGADVAEAAAWVALSRTILNLDEFVTRE